MTELIRRETVEPASSRADPKIVPGSDEAHDEATRAEDIAGNHAGLRGLGIRPKLMVGGVNDPEEREADALADRVMRMPEEEVVRQRVAMTGGGDAGGRSGVIRRKAGSVGAAGGAAPESVRQVLAQPGRPLDAETRAFFEPRFGVDLGNVRVHGGRPARDALSSLQARAFAYGSQIVMEAYPSEGGSVSVRTTLAHEIAHTTAGGRREGSVRREMKSDATARAVDNSGAVQVAQGVADDVYGAMIREDVVSEKRTWLNTTFREKLSAWKKSPPDVRRLQPRPKVPGLWHLGEGRGASIRALWAAIGHPGAYGKAWCGAFVAYCFLKAGIIGRSETRHFLGASALRAARKAGVVSIVIRAEDVRPGDIFSTGHHVGLIERISGDNLATIEGNTWDRTLVGGVYRKNSKSFDGVKVYRYERVKPAEKAGK